MRREAWKVQRTFDGGCGAGHWRLWEGKPPARMRGRDQASTTQQAIMESPQFALVLQQVAEISPVQYHSQPSHRR
jgi:hypothetical protein